ncbi:Tc toxin subunit A-related protein [Dinghuibacter silviterrae]|uniref:Virulence plasmid A protein n=1 Tax=Dinghuibacter silviterrae TaxID=1539049 RepID=A0A4R8DIJ0_9BACT|nr:neuraminidase-like domain-containing protein [Dinghuibacter silviterrae]TDW96986.1 virulence plasmid A protein [Dinghuibacter silviterrae]
MQKILFPIQSGDRGPEIKNLHEVILALSHKMKEKEFEVLFKNPDFRETFGHERSEGTFGEATRQIVSLFQVVGMKTAPTGMIDEATADAINTLLSQYGLVSSTPVVYEVQGTIYDEWIEPLKEARVMAFDKGIRDEHALGEAETDDKGRYMITYDPLQGSANVVVRVYDPGGMYLVSSGPFYNAPAQLTVDVNMGPRAFMGPSDFTRAVRTVRSLIGPLTIEDLSQNEKTQDLSFLNAKTTLSANVILSLVAAFRFAQWTKLEASVFYGILIQGKVMGQAIPPNADTAIEQGYATFLTLSVDDMIANLQQAALQNNIPYKTLSGQTDIRRQLQELKNAPPQVPGGTLPPAPVYAKLTLAGLNAAQQQAFLNIDPKTAAPAIWSTLSTDPAYAGAAGQAALAKLQLVFQLSSWTSDNTPLVSYLMGQGKLNTPDDLGTLVDKDVSDWASLLRAAGTAAPTDIQSTAATLAAGIEKIYPTQVFASRFQKNTSWTLANRDYITGVLTQPDFDLIHTPVSPYLNTHVQKNPLPAGVDQQTVTNQVMGIQRVYRSTPGADAALTLLSANIRSARQIYAMGKTAFVGQFGNTLGGATVAEGVFDQASTVHAAATYVAGQVATRLNNPSTNTMTDYNPQLPTSKFYSDYPDLANLFGIGPSYCACADCTSFLSIPAYVTDLLDYLFLRKTASGSNARALLQANNYKNAGLQWRRRPDIGDIDLNCDNTNTELPYIDIVNELLEDYIIPPIAAIRMLLEGNDWETVYAEFLIWLYIHLFPGTINPVLYDLLMKIGADPKTPICNISLLTPQAVVSEIFFSDSENYPEWITGGRSWVAQWVIRDQYITLKLALVLENRDSDVYGNIPGLDVVDGQVINNVKVDRPTLAKLSSVITQDIFNPAGGSEGKVKTFFDLVVMETHQTHLGTDDINANPEYTNTNVYNSLSDPFDTLGNNKWHLYPTLIPQQLPFDLYSNEANTFLEKMGKQRYALMETFSKQGDTLTAGIVIAYMGLSTGEADIIFIPRVQVPPAADPQLRFWGALDVSQPEVDKFLVAAGLDFTQLQTLLTLRFINPKGDSYIGDKVASNTCDTALMVITNMTSEKFDHINRFLRLWTKLNQMASVSISMTELDDCIMFLGGGQLNIGFGANLFYFLQLMQQLGLTATQLLTFYEDMDPGLYQQLFQNRQITNPLVAAFHWPLSGTTQITDAQANPGAVAVILTVCGITQDDLTAIINAGNGAYSALSLSNLSLIYSCGLLAGALGISVSDLFTFSGLVGVNPMHAVLPSPVKKASPESTFSFIRLFNSIQQAGFTVDDLNYVLTNQSNANPSLIPDPATVVNGLESIRSALQTAIASATVAPDPKGALLSKWLADPDLGWDKGIASKVLSILGQTDATTYLDQVLDNLRLFQLLRTQYAQSSTATYLERLPVLSLPDKTITGLQYDTTHYYIFVNDALAGTDSTYLGHLPGIDAAGQTAIQTLYQQSQTCPVSAVPVGSSVPAWLTANATAIAQNVPGFSWGQGALGFTGAMSAPVYNALLAQSADPVYTCALTQLLVASQGALAPTVTYVRLAAIPVIGLPDAGVDGLVYAADTGGVMELSFTGAMSAADCLALLGISTDKNFQQAVCQLFISAQPGQTVSTPLAALPSGWTGLPDLSGITGLSAMASPPMVSFAGQMSATVRDALNNLSSLNNWSTTVAALFQLANTAGTYGVTLPQPPGLNTTQFAANGVFYNASGTNMTLTYTGQMQPQTQTALLALSADPAYQAAIGCLYNQTSAIFGATLPPAYVPLPDGNIGSTVYTSGAIIFTGTPDTSCNDGFNLAQLGTDPGYTDAIQFMYSTPPPPSKTTGVVLAALPSISFPAGAPVSWQDGQLSYTGQMPDAERDTLLALSDNASYQAAVRQLHDQSQVTTVVSLEAVSGGGLPDGVKPSDLQSQGVTVQSTGSTYVLSFTGQMTAAQQSALLALVPPSTNDTYTQSIQKLYTGSQTVVVNTTPLAALPPVLIPSAAKTAGWGYDSNSSILYYSGAIPIPPATVTLLTAGIQTTDPDFAAAVQQLATLGANPGNIMVFAPPPDTPFSASGLTLSGGAVISYQGGTLSFTGPMSFVDYVGLLAQSPDPAYRNAVTGIYLASQPSAPGTVVTSTGYFGLPPLIFPPVYANQLSFSADTGTLTLAGCIASADLAVLQSLGSGFAYQQALSLLYQSSGDANRAAGAGFDALYATLATPTIAQADRYAYFLDTLSTSYQTIKEMDALSAQIASNFGVTAAVAGVLTNYVTAFIDPAFTGNNKALNPDPTQYPLAQTYMKLARAAFLINTFNLSSTDIQWLLELGSSIGTPDLFAWPTPSSPISFGSWSILNDLCLFERQYKTITIPDLAQPGQTTQLSVYDIISAALMIGQDLSATPVIPPNPGALLRALIQLTGWDPIQLSYLLNVGQPNLPNLVLNPLKLKDTAVPPVGCIPDLGDITTLLCLSSCFQSAGQLKVTPSRCVNWTINPITETVAVDIKQALKSIYPDDTSWMSAIQPLMNTLRQERRDALVAYLLSNKVTNPYGKFDIFPDTFTVYGNFLIDVEMGACQPTTRTIQAYCSIQLFVQRCLLNLEAPRIQANTTLDEDWEQWSWMGTYEGWYEARYTFLFPENLILPQALPNQSSFFQDLQNDLTQGAVTVDIVQAAYDNYLQSLDQVARLQLKGMWYDEPTQTLHVFACTYGGDPATFYYRYFKNIDNINGSWSPWEEVTADISSDQVIPVVQNGRLYLYWPMFTQATDEDKKTQTQTAQQNSGKTTASTPPPNKYWQIQLAFSEYKNGQWSGKKVSKDSLSSATILYSGNGPTLYPDVPDFVFVALDIPTPSSNAYTGTIDALLTNNTMVITCFQSSSAEVNLDLTFKLSGKDYDFSYSVTVDMGAPNVPVQELLDRLNNYIFVGNLPDTMSSGALINYTSSGSLATLLSILNPLLPSGLTIVASSLSYNTNGGAGTLAIIAEGGPNSFLLDPARGYATAIDLASVANYSPYIAPTWFQGSNWDNMLTEGTGALLDGSGYAILNAPSGTRYANLLYLQMGLWAKYQYLLTNSLDFDYLGIMMPFFYQDATRTFFVNQAFYLNGFQYYQGMELAFLATGGDAGQLSTFFSNTNYLTLDNGPYFQFTNFYHPFAHQFIKLNAQQGIQSILNRPIQLTGDATYYNSPEVLANPIVSSPNYKDFSFSSAYSPTGNVLNVDAYGGRPLEQMDFGPLSVGQLSAYGQYNWELFFHTVLLSAMMLSQNQQFEDADTWFKLIFNPTDTSSDPVPQKFWVTKPFFENTNPTLTADQILLYEIDPGAQEAFWLSVKLWRNDPYDPHMLAQYRIVPYMYTAFMKYLDNLIAWANFNYQQYTMESVNIAIQLYMLALECLGTEPEAIPPLVETPVCSYYQLELGLEALIFIDGSEGYLSDPVVQFENLIPPASPGGSPSGGGKPKPKIQQLPGLYFCIPPNQVLLGYWTKIETLLNQIRNCMNIKGQFQPLSPFPNVPGMGGPEGSSISDWGGILPNYRFMVMIQKATELCSEVRNLGSALLSALEKQDAEGLSLLRATQEVSVQQAVDKIKQLQITDANLNLTNLQDYQALINDKIAYYNGLVQGGLLQLEQQALALNQQSLSLEDPISDGTILAGILRQLPNFTMGINGVFGSPAATVTFGGTTLGEGVDCFVQRMSFQAHFDDRSASLANTNAGYTRRMAEWNFQLTMAKDELTQVGAQIQAAQNKIQIATQDEQNQQLLIQNAEDVETFLQNKYTNQVLYTWMVTQLSNVYFQSYQRAYSFAKQTEICFRYELGIPGTSYIQYGYWDSLHKGLLSGENLMNSLKQMETDYFALNVREYELTRQVSLAQLDPIALLQLKSAGSCYVTVPEELFDLDYPGQYFRRIKQVAVTLPGIVGPYTPVCLKMTLMSNSVRIDNTAGTAGNYPRLTDAKGTPTNDRRFLDNVAMTQYIATSSGVNDAGLFEMSGKDDRYVPFEGAGAISTWQIQLTSVYPQFDPSTITDLILHVKYTSREGGPALQSVASQSLQSKLGSALNTSGLTLTRGFSARRDFPTQWYKFLHPTGTTQELDLDTSTRFPYFTQGLTVKISNVIVLADMTTGVNAPSLYLSGQKLSNVPLHFGPNPLFGQMMYSTTPCKDAPGLWTINNGTGSGVVPVAPADINDLFIIFVYSLSPRQ